eukprot:TRINITY_DN41318_c0_g1_i1.p1 TRINITY_DN41318_c0_g1~~TRINITY_DN41318_c0_g1_i1.p1  ORF type:complete len:107 (+),score=0.18 TRINITY_DN41318_c0_g1_i1:424-744(+)
MCVCGVMLSIFYLVYTILLESLSSDNAWNFNMHIVCTRYHTESFIYCPGNLGPAPFRGKGWQTGHAGICARLISSLHFIWMWKYFGDYHNNNNVKVNKRNMLSIIK